MARKKKKRSAGKLSQQVVEYILTRDMEELATLSGEKIARALHRNRAYLYRKFKSDQNIGIHQFILREKIHRTVFLLGKNNDISITELSRRLGFLSVERFVREFIKYLAIDPRKYRELKSKL
ncbi:MAG: helix-turn-helix domain-containing protein [Candidatus Aminicenantes bacterium]|nr:helix-turn-helix domain-containing protein [Candidatus Aminicenantes bacterium]